MRAIKDCNGVWRLKGFEDFEFSSEEDALSASEFGIAFASEQAVIEWRNRQAAQRAENNSVQERSNG